MDKRRVWFEYPDVEFIRRQRDALAQALWDVRAILGFDNDGDPSPIAAIVGMGVTGFIDMMLAEALQARKDYDELLEEITLAES